MKPTTCDGELISAYLDGELAEEEGARVAEHIRRCARCAAEWAEMGMVREALLLLPEGTAPPGAGRRTFRRIATNLIAWSGLAGVGVAGGAAAASSVALLGSSLPAWYRLLCAAGFALMGVSVLPIFYHNLRALLSLRRCRGRWNDA